MCNAVFSSAASLRLHKSEVHHDAKTCVAHFDYERDHIVGVPTCVHCGLKLTTWRTLRTHIQHGACPVFSTMYDISGFFHDDLAKYDTPFSKGYGTRKMHWKHPNAVSLVLGCWGMPLLRLQLQVLRLR